MVVVKHDSDDTIVVIADDRGLQKPMIYRPDEGWSIGIVTISDMKDNYHQIMDTEKRERLFREAKAVFNKSKEK